MIKEPKLHEINQSPANLKQIAVKLFPNPLTCLRKHKDKDKDKANNTVPSKSACPRYPLIINVINISKNAI